jgi:hypothetical protein
MGVTAEEFRCMALNLPDAVEGMHMEHPDFRVHGRIFASLGYPDQEHGMLKLARVDQADYLHNSPEAFTPVKGAWGRRGSTCVKLSTVRKADLRRALLSAWSFNSRKEP